MNRIDEIVTFRALDADDVEMIVGRALAELTSAVERRHGVRVRVTPEAARFAAQQAALAAPGARGARRTVERLVHGPLSALVLTGKLTRHTVLGRRLRRGRDLPAAGRLGTVGMHRGSGSPSSSAGPGIPRRGE